VTPTDSKKLAAKIYRDKYNHSAHGKVAKKISQDKYSKSDKGRALIYKHNRRRLLWNKYGLTEDDYNTLLIKQNHKCAICEATAPNGMGKWHVDHCHTTGKVRGLLCMSCNIMLGKAKDSLEILQKAINYLQKE
jgi:hypothetical protein